MKKAKQSVLPLYVRIYQGREIYNSKVIEQNDKIVKVICVEGAADGEPCIMDFEKKEIEFEMRTEAEIESWFKTGLIRSEKRLIDSEFEVKFCAENLHRRGLLVERALGRPLKT
jgi:hypothetical protein